MKRDRFGPIADGLERTPEAADRLIAARARGMRVERRMEDGRFETIIMRPAPAIAPAQSDFPPLDDELPATIAPPAPIPPVPAPPPRRPMPRVCVCGHPVATSCAFGLSGSRAGETCGRPLCSRCARRRGAVDFCRVHDPGEVQVTDAGR